MVDYLKKTIIKKISKEVDISVKDTLIDSKNYSTGYPKLLFKKKLSDNSIEVIDFNTYDTYGSECFPNIVDVENLYICIDDLKFTSRVIRYDNGVLDLEDNISDIKLMEYISSIEFFKKDECEKKLKDYIYVSSLYAFGKRINYTTKEYYRRFEIGVFVYDDPNQDKCNNYMKNISKALDRDFNVLNDSGENIDYAYIFNPIKFDVEENGKLNRVIYGSIMIKTIEINF